MNRFKRITALVLVFVMALSLCGCRKKKDKEENAAMPVATAVPNQVFEVKLNMDNLFDYFYYKEYRSDVKGDDGKILSSQIAYGLQLKETFTAANDPAKKDTMKLKFEAAGVVLTGDYIVDFDTLDFSGPTYDAQSSKISEELVFWPKGNRTTTWVFGNYSTKYILYLENFKVTDVSGSIYIKYAEPEQMQNG